MKKKKVQSGLKKSVPKPSNPFEIKIHKVKHQVLGKKNKDVVGNPNRKQQKGLNARKTSLLKEYKNKNKSNFLRDKRLGENDASISLEEKMLKRFAKERIKSDKKTKYNLNDDADEDDDLLTHLGQSVAEIQDMKGPLVDSDLEDEDEDFGRLGSEHVEKLHFGGGDDEGLGAGKRKHADIVEEIIAKSKQAKYQRKVEKDETEEMTGKLDDDWKSLSGLLGGIRPVKKTEERKSTEKGKVDDYDVLVRELMYEKKGAATDRLKTEEEIAKQEMEQLESLERDRLVRMRGISSSEADRVVDTHRSADDLDDGFLLNDEDKKRKKVGFTLAYKDGKPLVDEEGGDGNVGGDAGTRDPMVVDAGNEADDDEEENEEESDDGDDEEDGDGYSDVEDEEADSESEDEEGEEEANVAEDASKTSGSNNNKGILKRNISTEVTKETETKKTIPFTYVMPTSVEELDTLLRPYEIDEQLIVIERIRKCHHPSLAEGNKEKLVGFFNLLLERFLDSCDAAPLTSSLLDGMTTHLYDMLRLDHGETGKHVHRHLVEMRRTHDFRSAAPLRVCLFLQLLARLYPTSDLSHPVLTPAFLYLGEILQRTSINSYPVVTSGLFLSALALDYVRLARRFMPEALNFLNGLLFLARGDEKNVDWGKVVPPCRPVGKHNRLLRIVVVGEVEDETRASTELNIASIASSTTTTSGSKKKKNDFASSGLTTSSKLCAVSKTVDLLSEYRQLYKDLPALKPTFALSRYFLSALPTIGAAASDKEGQSLIPTRLRDKIDDLLSACAGDSSSTRGRLTRLARPKPRPQPLPQFEPKFDMEFDGRKRFAGDQAAKDKQRLERQYKMELKAAQKDLRQDAAFLANVKIAEQLKKDKKRKDKVKEIYGHLSNQEGEHKQMERMKKRK